MSKAEIRRALLERRALREREDREAAKKINVAIAVMVVILVGYVAWLFYTAKHQPILERAAYLEGRYDLTREVALAQAESEVR